MTIESMGQQAKAAARILAQVSTEEKNAALQNIADRLWVEREAILSANQEDLAAAEAAGLGPALLDRLMLNEKRLAGIIADLRRVTDAAGPGRRGFRGPGSAQRAAACANSASPWACWR